jgi:RNA methyltransferase, TrmH family
MGAFFRAPLIAFDSAPRPRVALLPRAPRELHELEVGETVTFVLGAERDGLPPEVVSDCDETAAIPIAASADSLNVAMAGTVALYELRRR